MMPSAFDLSPLRPKWLKDPDAELDWEFDWTPWLAGIGESIGPAPVITLSDGLSLVGAPIVEGGKVRVFVSGGTAGAVESVACRITTTGTPPRTDERTLYLFITQR